MAKPDALDFRDRPFTLNISIALKLRIFPRLALKVLHQGETNACTGFGLSLVVEHLIRSSKRRAIDPAASPYMLYSMARRYDEFPGSTGDDGSSLRGALKSWFKHGVCSSSMFPALDMPMTPTNKNRRWWLDAVAAAGPAGHGLGRCAAADAASVSVRLPHKCKHDNASTTGVSEFSTFNQEKRQA